MRYWKVVVCVLFMVTVWNCGVVQANDVEFDPATLVIHIPECKIKNSTESYTIDLLFNGTNFDVISIEAIQKEDVLQRSGSFKLNGIDYYGRKDPNTYINVKYSIYDKYMILECAAYSYVGNSDFENSLEWVRKDIMISFLVSTETSFLESQGIRYQIVDEETYEHSDSTILCRSFKVDGDDNRGYIEVDPKSRTIFP